MTTVPCAQDELSVIFPYAALSPAPLSHAAFVACRVHFAFMQQDRRSAIERFCNWRVLSAMRSGAYGGRKMKRTLIVTGAALLLAAATFATATTSAEAQMNAPGARSGGGGGGGGAVRSG